MQNWRFNETLKSGAIGFEINGKLNIRSCQQSRKYAQSHTRNIRETRVEENTLVQYLSELKSGFSMLSRAGYEDDEKIFFWRIVNLLRRSENRREILSKMKCQTDPQIELSSKKDQTIIYQVHTHALIQSENFVFYINLFLDNGIVDKKRICKISTFQNQKTCTQTDSLLLRCPYEGFLVVGW